MSTIREIDAAWKRRVWRQIDVRQKQNQPFIYQGDEYTGGGAFIEILLDAVKKGKVQAYSPLDDAFTTPMDMAAFEKTIGGTEDSILVEDPITGEQVWTKTQTEFNVQGVTKYRLKEDWIFDRNAGRMVVRIIGIAPLMDRLDESGNFRGSLAMFWLYYPELKGNCWPITKCTIRRTICTAFPGLIISTDVISLLMLLKAVPIILPVRSFKKTASVVWKKGKKPWMRLSIKKAICGKNNLAIYS